MMNETKEHTPAEIIQQARNKARRALLECCGDEINRICAAFAHDTGLAVGSVSFDFSEVTTIGDRHKKSILSNVLLYHEDA